MKKFLVVFLTMLALALTACIFDSDESVMADWLSDQGIPSGYQVQTLSVEDLTPLSSEVFLDSTPKLANDRVVLGKTANISHDLVFDAAFYDSVFFAELQKTDSVEMFLALHVLKPFYQSKQFPADSLPLKEDVTLTISWKIEKGPSKSFVDSVSKIKPATWLSELNKWKPDSSADTTVTIAVSEKDSVLKIGLPSGLISTMKKLSRACRLQLRLSAPEASRAYRFYGVETASYPKLWASFPKDKSFIEFLWW